MYSCDLKVTSTFIWKMCFSLVYAVQLNLCIWSRHSSCLFTIVSFWLKYVYDCTLSIFTWLISVGYIFSFWVVMNLDLSTFGCILILTEAVFTSSIILFSSSLVFAKITMSSANLWWCKRWTAISIPPFPPSIFLKPISIKKFGWKIVFLSSCYFDFYFLRSSVEADLECCVIVYTLTNIGVSRIDLSVVQGLGHRPYLDRISKTLWSRGEQFCCLCL